MLDELNAAITDYHQKWHILVAARTNKQFFERLTPITVGWKATDLTEFDRYCQELRESCDQIHFGWVNERWLGTFHLRDVKLDCGISVIKLMQRRPGSNDATGLDHLDFLLPQDVSAKELLEQEPNLKWSEEKNGAHCKWISIWFEGTEAKLRADTVIDTCIEELQEVNPQNKP